MGIRYMWDVLEPTKKDYINISDLTGKKLAVDLSCWVTEFRKIDAIANLFVRTLFFRVLEFMRAGVSLVFVVDGKAPEMKMKAMKARWKTSSTGRGSVNLDRPGFNRIIEKCLRLIESLGIPYIRSVGEAEGLCAYLNRHGYVDGCISEDSDIFCYGARTVYRKTPKQAKIGKGYTLDVYDMDIIETELKLNQKSLVTFALLVGSDYDLPGVKNVGKEKTGKLIAALQEKGLCPLQRVLDWKENSELVEFLKKGHCKHCQQADSSSSPCHMGKLETDVRQKALSQNKDFPNQEIIDEFMKEKAEWKDAATGLEKKWDRELELPALVNCMRSSLGWGGEKVMDKMSEMMIHQIVQGRKYGPALMYAPSRIHRECKFNFKSCYEVEFSLPVGDTWSIERTKLVKVEQVLISRMFPELYQKFLEKTPQKPTKSDTGKGLKRKMTTTMANQQTLASFIIRTKVKKQLFTDPTTSSTDV